MSTLKELLKKHCPDGVEYVPIGSLMERVKEKGKDDLNVKQVYVVSNTRGIVRSEDYHDNSIHSDDTSNYTILKQDMFAYNPSRLNIGSIGRLKSTISGLVSPMYVVFSVDKSVVDVKYFEYFLKSPKIINKIDSLKEEGARFRFDYNRWNWISIPLPPIEVQKEIVRILDTFTKYQDLLNRELELRKKQYEYYRNYLFNKIQSYNNVLLGDIADISVGSKPEFISDNKTEFEYINAGTTNSGYTNNYNCLGDTVTTPSRGQGGIGYIGYQKNNFWLGALCYQIRSNKDYILTKYIYYYLKNNNELILKIKNSGGLPSVNRNDLIKINIKFPSLEYQKEIIDILDQFDTLCNDITRGLPAEIELRKKQYEYYRDKLLTFKEKKK